MPSPDATPPLPVFTDGQWVRQRELNRLPVHARQLFDAHLGGFRTQKPMCVVVCAPPGGGTPIAHNTYTHINFTTELIDTDGMWSSGATFRISTPGVYLLDWRAALQAPADADARPYLAAIIYVNGRNPETDAVAFSRQRFPAGTPMQCHASAVVALDLGAVVGFGMVQRTTSDQSLLVDQSNGGCYAALEWLAPLDSEMGATE